MAEPFCSKVESERAAMNKCYCAVLAELENEICRLRLAARWEAQVNRQMCWLSSVTVPATCVLSFDSFHQVGHIVLTDWPSSAVCLYIAWHLIWKNVQLSVEIDGTVCAGNMRLW